MSFIINPYRYAAAGFDMTNSLVFNQADSAVLKRTPASASNRNTWTFSFWMKRGKDLANSVGYGIFSSYSAGNDSGYFESGIHPSEDHYFFEEWSNDIKKTSAELRDPGAFYHIVLAIDTTQSIAEDRQKVYINGARITAFDTDNTYTEDQDLAINTNAEHWIGGSEYFGETASTRYFDGYLADINFTDGTAYGPEQFGEFNDNGIWVPKNPSVTYGTNGFRLEFKQTGTGTASATTIGADTSGNNNHWTSHNLASTDVMTDTPTLAWPIIASHHGRYATNTGGSHILSQGNLTFAQDSTAAYNFIDISSIPFSSGKWYVMGEPDAIYNANGEIGLMPKKAREETVDYYYLEDEAILYGFELSNSMDLNSKGLGISPARVHVAWPVTSATGDRQVLAVDFDNNKIWGGFYDTSADDLYWYNASSSSWVTTDLPATGSGESMALPSGYSEWMFWLRSYASRGSDIDFGSRNGGILTSITAPSGFKQINSDNITAPTVPDPTAGFQAITYIGDGGTHTIPMGNTFGTQNLSNASTSSVNNVNPNAIGFRFTAPRDCKLYDFTFYGASGTAGNVDAYVYSDSSNSPGSVLSTIGTGINMPTTAKRFELGSALNLTQGTHYWCVLVPNGTIDVQLTTVATTAGFLSGRSVGGSSATSIVNNLTSNQVYKCGVQLSARTQFQPDLVMIKNRDTTDEWSIYDAPRGVTKHLNTSNATETTDADTLTAFNSTGFVLGDDDKVNTAGERYLAYCWRAGGGAGSSNEAGSINTTSTTVDQTYGFSISTYEGNATSGATFGHGLGKAPEMVWIKPRDAGEGWTVYHVGLGGTIGTYLNMTNTSYSGSYYWNNTAPSSTVVTLGNHVLNNGSGNNMVAYCWAPIEGFSHFGKYIGNGSANGTLIYTGFKPAWVMIKNNSSAGSWYVYDSTRSPFNEVDDQLVFESSTAETTGSEEIDFLSNGFKCRTTDAGINSGGSTYLYAAFASHPTWGGEDGAPATAV